MAVVPSSFDTTMMSRGHARSDDAIPERRGCSEVRRSHHLIAVHVTAMLLLLLLLVML